MFYVLVLLLAFVMHVNAAVRSGPWLQAATPTSMTVMFETTVTEASRVEYGTTTAYGKSVCGGQFNGRDCSSGRRRPIRRQSFIPFA